MSSGDSITIYPKPTLTTRFPGRWHPNTDALVSKSQSGFLACWSWAVELDKELYPSLDLDSWIPATCPAGPDDRVLIASRWVVWLFLCDDFIENDTLEEAKQKFITYKKILSRDPDRELASPPEIILDELCNMLISVNDASLRKLGYMILSDITAFFKVTSSKEDRKRAVKSGFEEYMKVRLVDVGGWVALKLILWARGITPPFGSSTMHPKLYRLMEISVVHATLANDLFSYRNELRQFQTKEAEIRTNAGEDNTHGYTVFNWMAALIQIQGVSYEEACEEMGERIRGEEEKYLALLEELRVEYMSTGDDVGLAMLEKTSQALVGLMGGNTAWSVVCGRYNNF